MLSREGFLLHEGTSGGGSNGCGGRKDCFVAKEHMFDKVVTPSDVGKLNRLVIPKQYAEKYLPLDTVEAGGKGLLLSFEDRAGKSWRFRYSYWSSSQSYVMTKGWSRFVKEKGLDAGDTVSFGRGVGDNGARPRLYIDWKPRLPENGRDRRHPLPGVLAAYPPPAVGFLVPPRGHNNWRVSTTSAAASDAGDASRQLLYFRLQAARPPQMEVQRVPVVCEQAAAAKRVRLFGVNLDFPEAGGRAISRSSGRSVSSAQSHGGNDETPARKEMQSTLDLCL